MAKTWGRYRAAAVVPPPEPEDIIVLNFEPGMDPLIQAEFEAARDFLQAGFITPPVLFNGDTQIHIDVFVNNDPPFDGVPFGIVGSAGPDVLRPDGTTYSGTMNFEEVSLPLLGPLDCVVTHEMMHVLGLGTGPNWNALRVNIATANDMFVGANALAEYQAMAGGFPAAVGIPVEFDTGNPGSDGGHWNEDPGHASGQDCLSNEMMSYLADGSCTFSRVSAAALRDLGYDYNIAHGAAFACGGA